MNHRWLSFVIGPLTFTAACGASAPEPRSGGRNAAEVGGGRAGEVGGGGAGVDPEIARVLDDERARLAELDARIAAATGDDAFALRADRTARASFVAHLRSCAAGDVACPPSLDEPAVPPDYDEATGTLSGPFDADADRWPAAAAAIAARACGCRTRACVEWTLADLDRWERALPPQDADRAAPEVTLARECAWARLGRRSY
jgi:hypothetical protein